jgi:hypothetical protein
MIYDNGLVESIGEVTPSYELKVFRSALENTVKS